MPARSDCLPRRPRPNRSRPARNSSSRASSTRRASWSSRSGPTPKHVQQWWGPHGFTNPRCDWDARPGEPIHIDMKGPDGTVYPMTGEFREVVEPERLVFLSAVPDGKGGSLFEVLNTVTFHEQRRRRRRSRSRRRSSAKPPAADVYLKGMNEGWAQTLDRLAAYVAKV